jgi:multiple sugar transport system permease protein
MQLPLYIWMMKGYMDGIPIQLDDAAKIDGCNRFQAFSRVILRSSLPGIVSFSILVFLFTWNDFIFALSLTISDSAKTLTVGMTDFFSDTTIEWTFVSAAGFISILPALVFVLFLQRYLIKGLVEGAIKG